MRIGIVGSRKRTDRENVIKVVDSLDLGDTVVSGGCFGVDTWAEIRARERGLKTLIFRPDLSRIQNRLDMIARYHQRNKRIAENSDIIYAFVTPDRKGGTENTIMWAKKLGKKIILM